MMDKPILIITLGTRDIQVKEEAIDSIPLDETRSQNVFMGLPCFTDQSGIIQFAASRTACETISSYLGSTEDQEKVNRIRESLTYPIFAEAVRFVKKEHKGEIGRIIAVVTNQAAPKFRNKDTLYVPAVLTKLYALKGEPIPEIETFECQENPSDHLAVATLLDREWNKTVAIDAKAPVYLMAQTGVPILNQAIFLRCLAFYPNLTSLVKLESQKSARRSNLPLQFRTMYYAFQIREARKQHRYFEISQLNINEGIKGLAGFCHHLLMFNGPQAHAALSITSGEIRDDLYELCESMLDNCKDQEPSTLHWIMWKAATFAYENGDYPGFLIRTFALSENILLPQVEKIVGAKLPFDPSGKYAEWNAAIAREEFRSFREFFNAEHAARSKSQNPSNRKKRKPSRPHFDTQALLLKWKFGNNEREKDFLDIIEQLRQIRSLRNIAAHKLEGVSDKEIERQLSKNTDLTPFATKHFFEQMNDYISDKIICRAMLDLFSKVNEEIETILKEANLKLQE